MNITFVIILILGCVLISCIQYITNSGKKYGVIAIALLSVILIINSNWSKMPDLTEYLANYYFINTKSNLFNVQPNYYGFEILFMTISYIIKKIQYNEALYLCSLYLINFLAIYIGGKLIFCSNKITISDTKKVHYICIKPYYSAVFISLWIGYFGLLYGMVVLRAGISTSFVFLGSFFVYNKKYIKSIIIYMAAIFIQQFSILFIVGVLFAYRFIHIKSKKQYYIWLIICVMLWLSRISLFLMDFINLITIHLSKYFNRFIKFSLFYNSTLGNGFFSKKNMLFLFLGFCYVYFRPRYNKRYDFMLNIFLVGLTIAYLTNEITVGYRVSDMFFVFSVPLSYSLVAENTKMGYRSRMFVMVALIIIPFIFALRITGIVR